MTESLTQHSYNHFLWWLEFEEGKLSIALLSFLYTDNIHPGKYCIFNDKINSSKSISVQGSNSEGTGQYTSQSSSIVAPSPSKTDSLKLSNKNNLTITQSWPTHTLEFWCGFFLFLPFFFFVNKYSPVCSENIICFHSMSKIQSDRLNFWWFFSLDQCNAIVSEFGNTI